MEKVLQMRQQFLRSRRLPALVIGLTLAILGLAIGWSCLHLREKIREQIANRDGENLYAVSLLQQYSEDTGEERVSSLDDPAEQFNLMMRISRLKGVLGIRLFTPAGAFFNAFPAYISEAELPAQELGKLRNLKPVSHFYPKGRLEEVDLLAQAKDAPVPLLVVDIPLHSKGERRLLGVAQFIIDGESIAREYAELDRHLFVQAAIAFLVGGGILAVALALAFRRIQQANRLLTERTESLLRANQELALAARTSAVGAVAAHLIHGLKNPLSGLQTFVSSRLEDQPATPDSDWHEAVATTQRMQNLIGEVVRVLEEQQAVGDYEVSLEELVEIISGRMLPVARSAGVRFAAESAAGEGSLSNRDANLILLILENLIQNAVQATPAGKAVRLSLARAGERVLAEVRDEGAGFPASLQEHLFMPCRSTKPGGGGIGLAISKQLANHLGAVLELKSSTSQGCVFRLSLPASRSSAPSPLMAEVAGGNRRI